MKTRLAAVFAIMFLLLMGIVQGAAAQTGCFPDTNGHWAETFICWLKDNGIVSGYGDGTYRPENQVTRGEMAVYAKNVANYSTDAAQTMADTAQANALAGAQTMADTAEANAIAEAQTLVGDALSTGDIHVNAGLNDWQPNGTAGHSVARYTNVIELHAPGAGTFGYQITPDLPSTLYGRLTYTHSVKLCYDATWGASITGVFFRHYLLNAGAWEIYKEVTDTDERTDSTCRVYTFPSDGAFYGSDHVVLFITTSFSNGSQKIQIGATTFTLVPSIYPGVLSPEDTSADHQRDQAVQSEGNAPGTAP